MSRLSCFPMGPMSVSSSRGSPTFSRRIPSTRRSRKSEAMERCTRNRLAAIQSCPLCAKPPRSPAAAACVRSALSSTMNGSFPASSKLVEDRLQEWDKLPPDVQKELLANQATITYLAEIEGRTPEQRRQKIGRAHV